MIPPATCHISVSTFFKILRLYQVLIYEKKPFCRANCTKPAAEVSEIITAYLDILQAAEAGQTPDQSKSSLLNVEPPTDDDPQYALTT